MVLSSLLLAVSGTGARAQETVPIEVQDVDLRTNETLATIVLRSEQPIDWSVEPASRTLVVFLPRTVPGPEALDRSSRTGLVSLVEVGFAVPGGVPTTRITVHSRKAFEHEVEDSGAGLTIRLKAAATRAEAQGLESADPPSSATEGSHAGAELEQALRENELLRQRLSELHADRLELREALEGARKEVAASQAAARDNDDSAALTAEKRRLEEELSVEQGLVAKTREEAARLEARIGELETELASVPEASSAQEEQRLAQSAERERELEEGLRESRSDASALRAWLSRAPEILQARDFVVREGESCLSLRPEPDPGAAQLECLPSGEPLEAVSFRPDWLRVRTAQGKEGWVRVARVAPAEPLGGRQAETALAAARSEVAELEEKLAGLGRQLEAETQRANAAVGQSENAAEVTSRLDLEMAERRAAEGALQAAQSRIARLEEDVAGLQAVETGTQAASAQLEAARAQAEIDRRRLNALLGEVEFQQLTVARHADPCLTVRTGPGTDQARLDCLEPGTTVTVEDATAGWLAVRAPSGVAGWVASRFIEAVQAVEESERLAELERRLAASEEQSQALAARIMVLGAELESTTRAAAESAEAREAERARLADQLELAKKQNRETLERLELASAERQQAREALAAAREQQSLERAEALSALEVRQAAVRDEVDPCLSLREEPAVGSRALDCLAPGTEVSTVALAGGWFRIRLDDGREGWSAGEFLESLEQRELRELRTRLSEREERLAALEGRIADLDGEAAQAAELRRSLEESNQQATRAQEELAALREQNAEAERRLSEARQENDRLGALAGSAGEVPILTSALEQARGALGASEQRIAALEKQLAEKSEAQVELEVLEAARQESERTVGQLREQLASATDSLAEAQASNTALAERLSGLESEQAERVELEAEAERLRARMSGLETELYRMRESMTAAQAANDELRSQLSDFEAERSRLASERDQSLESAGRVEKLMADLTASKLELAEATAKNLELQASNEELASRLEGSAALESEVTEQVEKLNTEIAASKQALSQAEARNRELETAEAELTEIRGLLAEARSERDDLTRRVAMAEAAAAETAPTVVASEESAPVLEPLPSSGESVLDPDPAVVTPASPLPSAPEVVAEEELPTAESPELVASDLEAFALAWARAWSEQRVADYLSCYSAAFTPPLGMPRAQWESQRRERLTRPEFIEVGLSNFDIEIMGPDRATVTFDQEYRSNTFQDRVVKTLELVREGNLWRIAAERGQ